MNSITLRKPIKIDGKPVDELTYDVDEITAEAFAEAEQRKFQASGSKGAITAPVIEMDYSMQLYIGFAAIIAVNPKYDYNDLLRISGRDLISVQRVGRSFMLASGEETEDSESEAGKSVNASETTPASSTQA